MRPIRFITALPTRYLLCLLLLGVGLTHAAQAQEMAVPADVQYPLFLKILTLDRELEASVGDEIVIGVLHQPQIRESWRAAQAFLNAIEASNVRTLRGRRIRTVPIEMGSFDGVSRALNQHGVDVLYVAHLRAVEIREVAALAQRHRLRTLTGIPAYVSGGVAVGIGLAGNKPEILINRQAAAAEGASYNAQLLRLARVVED